MSTAEFLPRGFRVKVIVLHEMFQHSAIYILGLERNTIKQ